MNRLYYTERYIFFDENPMPFSFAQYHYGEMPNYELVKYDDFYKAYDYLTAHPHPHIATDTTFFRKRKCLRFRFVDLYKTMTAKTFKPFDILTTVEPIDYTPTIKQLMNELPADEFLLYCKDNGFMPNEVIERG